MVLASALTLGLASAQTIVYIDADGANTVTEPGGVSLTDPSVSTDNAGSTTDGKWNKRLFGNEETIWETWGAEGGNLPMLATTITGLTPGANYQVFVFFQSGDDTNLSQKWDILAGLASDSLTKYTRTHPDSSDAVASDFTTPDVVVAEGNRLLVRTSLGNAVANASGEITIYVDSNGGGSSTRTWYDGVGYELPPADDDNDGLPDAWELSFDGVQDLAYLDGTKDAGAGPGIGTGDYDGDGLSDMQEYNLKTNPTLADTDGDGIGDGDETTGAQNPYHADHVPGDPPAGAPGAPTDPLKADTDGDGIDDGEEIAAGSDTFVTNPNDEDTEGDDMPDLWEINNSLNPTVDDAGGDPDGDGLDNVDESYGKTDPRNPDTDADGYSDGVEDLFGYWTDENSTGTDPLDDDTDGDGIKDGKENPDSGSVAGPVYNSDPNKADTDGDFLPDGWEVLYGLDATDNGLDADKNPIPGNPNGALGDPDGDGLSNDKEYALGTNPQKSDTDGDTINDFDEASGALNPYKNGVLGTPPGDPTDPAKTDTDDDGLADNEEIASGSDGFVTNPTKADTDGDGDADKSEIVAGSDPLDPDSLMDMDGDGYTKATEIAAGTDPDDPASFPRPAANELWVDFDRSADAPDQPLTQPGFHSYSATHEVAESFTRQTFPAFGTTVGLAPSWPDTTDPHVEQMYDRGDAATLLWSGDLRPLVRDWIGIDTRPANGGNGPFDGTEGAPTRLVLTLDGLPADTYEWRSFHHDVEKLHGMFLVEVSTDGGTTFAPVAGTLPDGAFPMTSSTGGSIPPADMLYRGFPNPGSLSPADLPSTVEFNFTADGSHDVQIRFTPYSTAQVHRAFFQGAPSTTYEVTKSDDLTAGSFAPLTTPLRVTTGAGGIGQAVVPASETTHPKAFFRLEER